MVMMNAIDFDDEEEEKDEGNELYPNIKYSRLDPQMFAF